MLDSFLTKQNEIYATLRAQAINVPTEGIRFEKHLFAKRGGFVVALKHEARAAIEFASMSRRIASIVPSVEYSVEEIHTTLGMCAKSAPFAYDVGDVQHRTLLRTLQNVVKAVTPSEICIDYVEYILTPETVIAVGVPNQAFVALVEALRDAADQRFIALEPAWGAHVTVARFMGEASPEALASLQELMHSPPPWRSRASAVAVGYSFWKLSPERPQAPSSRILGQFVAQWERKL